jgi:hypothetical protein
MIQDRIQQWACVLAVMEFRLWYRKLTCRTRIVDAVTVRRVRCYLRGVKTRRRLRSAWWSRWCGFIHKMKGSSFIIRQLPTPFSPCSRLCRGPRSECTTEQSSRLNREHSWIGVWMELHRDPNSEVSDGFSSPGIQNYMITMFVFIFMNTYCLSAGSRISFSPRRPDRLWGPSSLPYNG